MYNSDRERKISATYRNLYHEAEQCYLNFIKETADKLESLSNEIAKDYDSWTASIPVHEIAEEMKQYIKTVREGVK